MADNLFEIQTDDHSYHMVLPYRESDYIQGLLANTQAPYELEMLRAMASVLKPGDLVFDVGANIGNHTLYLAVVAGCRIQAFEPNPDLCKPLQESIALNKLAGKVKLYSTGVGAEKGKARFSNNTPENLGGQSLAVDDSDTADIPVIALDSLKSKEKVRAIKVDVEGMEIDVLNGARQLISRDKPYLFVEAQTEADFEALQGIVVELGYVYWDTFNATPTHWFIHKDELGEEAIIDHYFEKGRDSYKLRLAKREVQEKLNEANKKYRLANDRISELKEKLNLANEKYRSVTSQSSTARDQLKAEIERLRGLLASQNIQLNFYASGSDAILHDFDFGINEDDVG